MRVGFIGFGEAASSISNGLRAEGLEHLSAYDIMANHPDFGPRIKERAAAVDAVLTYDLPSLLDRAEIVVCATSAKYALDNAREAIPYLGGHHLYVDLNAASPMVKEAIAKELASRSILFADVAVMESVPRFGHKVPMLVSGSGSDAFVRFASRYGMDVKKSGEVAGQASAIKMARSSFMKGITMLLFETLELASRYDATDTIMSGLDATLRQKPLEETANILMTRTVDHAARRVGEMQEVQNTLRSLGLDDVMAEASKRKIQNIADSGLREFFHFKTPKHYSDVLQAMDKLASARLENS